MSFNAPPPPPPPSQLPEFGQDFDQQPLSPKNGKGTAILIGAVAVLVLGILVVGATWFMKNAAKPDAVAVQTLVVTESPADKSAEAPAEEPSPAVVEPSATPEPTDAAEWSTVPTPVPSAINGSYATSETRSTQEDAYIEKREAQEAEIRVRSDRHCPTGARIMTLAETAKHYVAICDQDGTMYYRGEGKKSGLPMKLEAWQSGQGFTAVNGSGAGKTTYYFDRNHLTVTTGSKVQLDDQIIDYWDLSSIGL